MGNNFYYIVDGVVAVNFLFLAVLSLLRRGYKNPTNFIFAMFCIVASLWILTGDFGNDIRIPGEISIISNYISLAAGLAMSILLMIFVVRLAGSARLDNFVNRALIPLWILCGVSGTPLLVASGVVVQGDIYGLVWGPLVGVYLLGLACVFIIMIYAMVYGLRNAVGLRKRQLIATAVGVGFTVPLVLMLSLILPLISGMFWTNQFSAAPALVLVFSIYFGVVRYHLFDIRMAAVRTLAYVLSLLVMVFVYYILASFVEEIILKGNYESSEKAISIGLTIGLLFIFNPIKIFFDHLTNRIFYRGYYKSDEFLARLSRILTSTTDLRRLLERVANEIATTLKSEQVFFFIGTNDGHYVTAGSLHYRQVGKEEAWNIQNYYTKKQKHGVMVISLLDEDDPFRRSMSGHRIELVLPLVQEGAVGYLCLGDHRISHYTKRDIKVLSTVADELIIAIRNTLSIEEVRAANAKLRQLDKAKDEFVSVASHELRTPMTVIRGYVSMLQHEQVGSLNDQQKNIIEKVNASAKTLIDLVNDMLDLAKLEANKLEINLVTSPLDKLVNNSLDKIRLLYNNKGVILKYDNSDPNIQIATDSEKFERIMLNLLSNAYKFTPSGGNAIITTEVNRDKKIVTIRVADTGIGMTPEALESLFKKFSQVDDYLQRQTGGTGLGLVICKQMVEKLGGKIWATSQLNVGSQFMFTLPLNSNQK